jgi:hypothetical protein
MDEMKGRSSASRPSGSAESPRVSLSPGVPSSGAGNRTGARFWVESRLRRLAARIDQVSSRELAVKLTLKKAAAALHSAGVPFLLAGGAARWARGGPSVRHDLDFIIKSKDAAQALQALCRAGLRPTPIPEVWCLRAWNGDVAVDLILQPIGLEVTDDLIDSGDELEVMGVAMRVIRLEDDFVTKLLSIDERSLGTYESALRAARSIREQPDWEEIRTRTEHSPFARAFFVLTEGLGIVGSSPD